MNFDLVFECDYGVRSPVKNLLKDLLKKYNANILPMTTLFINNNPYSLELFVALNFDSENELLKYEICDKFKSIGNELRTDLCLTDFLNSMGARQFNFRTLVDEIDCEFAFKNSFFFAEKDELKVIVNQSPKRQGYKAKKWTGLLIQNFVLKKWQFKISLRTAHLWLLKVK